MAMAPSLVFVVFTMFIMLMGSPTEVEGMTCGQVDTSMAPCITYLKGSSPLNQACCNGVKGLNSAAKTSADRQTACKCLVAASKGITGINYPLAAGLPGKCGVKISYKISPSTDCSKVN